MTQVIGARIAIFIAFAGITAIMFIRGYKQYDTNNPDEQYNFEDWWLYFLFIGTGVLFLSLLTN